MRKALFAAAFTASLACAATTITDVITSPFGSGLFSGTLTIACNRAQAGSGTAIGGGRTVLTIVNGVLSVDIAPYDTAAPSTTCGVTYNSTDTLGNPLSSFERWIVPTTTRVLTIHDVLVTGTSPIPNCPTCLRSSSSYSDPAWLLGLAFNKILPGTGFAGTYTVPTGGQWTYTGSGIINANKILGVTLTGLTGLVYMTAGVPSVATGANVVAAFTGTPNGAKFLRDDGALAVPAGAGTNGTNGQGLTSNGAGAFGTPVTLAPSATTDATNATNIASGTLPNARLAAVPNSALANSAITITPSCGVAGGGSTSLGGTATINGGMLVNAQTGTTYTYLNGDCGKLVTHSNGSAIAATLPQANGSTFVSGWSMEVQNRGVGTLTITPTTSTIDGAASLALTTGQGVRVVSSGTDYFTQRGMTGGGGVSSFISRTGAVVAVQDDYAPTLLNCLTPSRATTILTWGTNLSASLPCLIQYGSTIYPFTSSFTTTVTSGTGTLILSMNSAGVIKANWSAASGLTCSAGCTVAFSQATLPAGERHLYTWSAASAVVWDATGSDKRAYLSFKPSPTGGGFVQVTAGDTDAIALDTTKLTDASGTKLVTARTALNGSAGGSVCEDGNGSVTNSGCTGGGGTALKQWYPNGSYYDPANNYSPASATVMVCNESPTAIPVTSTFTYAIFYVSTSEAAKVAGVNMYSSAADPARLGPATNTGVTTASTGRVSQTMTGTTISISPATVVSCFASDATSTGAFASAGATYSYFQSPTTPRLFSCSNAFSIAGGVITWPATCGTRTALVGGTVFPMINLVSAL